jgi:hypothetical protein
MMAILFFPTQFALDLQLLGGLSIPHMPPTAGCCAVA